MAAERTELDIKLEIKKLQLELEEMRQTKMADEHKALVGKWVRVIHGGWNEPLGEKYKSAYMHIVKLDYATEVASNVYLLSARGDMLIEVYQHNIVGIYRSDGDYLPALDFYSNRYDIMHPNDIKICLEDHKKESDKRYDDIIAEIK